MIFSLNEDSSPSCRHCSRRPETNFVVEFGSATQGTGSISRLISATNSCIPFMPPQNFHRSMSPFARGQRRLVVGCPRLQVGCLRKLELQPVEEFWPFEVR